MLIGDVATKVDFLNNWKWNPKNQAKYKVARWIPEEKGERLADIIVEASPKYYFESGTANGYSTLYAAVALPPEGEIHTFDPADRDKVWGDFSEWKELDKITYHHAKFEEVKPYLGSGRKVFFIDGDHSKTGVLEDWEAIEHSLAAEDVVVFDDVAGERRTLKAFLNILGNLPHTFTKYEVERCWFNTVNRDTGNIRKDCLGIIRILRCDNIEARKN